MKKPSTLSFTKMQGLGNDFIVLNNLTQDIHLSTEQIQRMADRHFGVGCDQILLLDPAPNVNVDFGYRIFNADGSMSEQCGNGARCLAKFIQQQQLSKKTELKIATKNTTMELTLLPNGEVRVNMGEPNFIPDSLPLLFPQQEEYELSILNQPILFHALSMGNPHAIIVVEDLDKIDIAPIGMAFGKHAVFPEGVNVGFMQIMDKSHIQLRVFERGVGETLACGSGACAAMVSARLRNAVNAQVEVMLSGGKLNLEWQGEGHPVFMSGPATLVYAGQYYL